MALVSQGLRWEGSAPEGMLKLIIEDDEGRKTVVPFAREEITVGRQEGNTIRLTERNVSRRHARLLKQHDQVMVEDLGSYNGIRVNGEKIAGQVEIKDGDLIQIGDYDLAIQRETVASAAVTGPSPTAPGIPEMSDYDSIPEPGPQVIRGGGEANTTPAQGTPTPNFANDARRHATAVIRIDKLATDDAGPVEDVPLSEAPRLVVLNTEFAGREFACVRTELKVGRAEENDISLDHRSLSREHIKLRRGANGEWRVVDLQSANGVSVNGETYVATALRSGDVLTLGHVKFRFLAAGEKGGAARVKGRAAASSEGPSKALLGGIIGAAVLATVAVGYLFRDGGEKPAPQPQVKPAQDASKQALEGARAAFARGDLDGATDLLLSLRTPDGSRPPEADKLMDQVKSERAHSERLGKAERAVAEGQLDAADRLVEDASATTVFTAKLARVREMVAAARARAQPPPDAPQPSPTPVEPQRKPQPGPAPRPPPPVVQESATKLYDDAVAAIKGGKLDQAESLLKRCVAADPSMAPCYRAFGVVYAKLGRPAEGARYYREFLRLAPDDPAAAKVRQTLQAYEQSGGK